MNREEAINKLNWALDNNTIEDVQSAYDYIMAIKMAIKALEQEPKTRHWINHKDEYQCSQCREIVIADIDVWEEYSYDYCPNCGARMQEVDNEEA